MISARTPHFHVASMTGYLSEVPLRMIGAILMLSPRMDAVGNGTSANCDERALVGQSATIVRENSEAIRQRRSAQCLLCAISGHSTACPRKLLAVGEPRRLADFRAMWPTP